MTIAVITPHEVVLPSSPYQMWVDGELHDYLHIPHDGSRVEIIDGEIVVSPGPRLMHQVICSEITEIIGRARMDASYRWRSLVGNGLNFVAEENAYIPDVTILDTEVMQEALRLGQMHLITDQAEMVVEVTSPSTAKRDRPPTGKQADKGKWCGYARAEIPYYLLIDLDPAVSSVTLYSIPDQASVAYLHKETWTIGETITLPDPIGIEIPTDAWKPWD
ncbi:Uma2 family endonuclease [Nonomuraea turkmeniaca]|uniref:Uma2 family endonuclease n=1 Tax=Nonomuraea turkmeniaca TaxID=103838 RepID=A0A5S4FGJ6_9ACTN|nr:Uma2 family endonuclease [Nonomuraea turkmeniaca]TMR18689.1 Uma2 family endonuclease [Nonomuraea turkmeniaca]